MSAFTGENSSGGPGTSSDRAGNSSDGTGPVPHGTGESDFDRLRRAHDERRRTVDPMIPPVADLDLDSGDALLTVVDGDLLAVGIARTNRPDVTTMAACWSALQDHNLSAVRVLDANGMHRLLEAWRTHLGSLAGGPDRATGSTSDSSASVNVPSHDTILTAVLLDHGLSPRSVLAARPRGRTGPAGPAAATGSSGTAGTVDHASDASQPRFAIRPLRAEDVDAAARLWLAEVRWDAQFGSVTERASTPGLLYDDTLALLAPADDGRPAEPTAWVAEHDGEIVGLAVVEMPERAGWVASFVAAAPVAYIGCVSVRADQRGTGVGSALVSHVHGVLDDAGIAVTLLHYAGFNPLSVPFWNRHGYRPLWTTWEVRPYTALR